MRLGILTQYYPPEMGAPPARLHELARYVVAAGHQVFVLTAMPNYPRGRILDGYGGVYRRELLDGVSVQRAYIYPTKSVALVPRLSSYFSFVASSIAVGAAALPPIDALVTESPPLFLGIAGYALARLKRAKWIFNVSDLWPESAVRLGVVRPGLALAAAERLEAFCYSRASLVSGQSREILDSIRRRFPDVAAYHWSNGVDTDRFRPELRSADARRLLAPDGARTIALYAGLHGVAQGLEQVLEAAARLRDVEGLRFAFVGDGPHKEALAARARALQLANLRFLEPQPHAEMARLLASADVALVPLGAHLPGAVPSKVYEAMGSGLPVVVAADGEVVRIVERARAGIAVRPGDVDGLERALRTLARDPELAGRLGRHGRAAAVERHDRKQISARFIAQLAMLLGEVEPAPARLAARG